MNTEKKHLVLGILGCIGRHEKQSAKLESAKAFSHLVVLAEKYLIQLNPTLTILLDCPLTESWETATAIAAINLSLPFVVVFNQNYTGSQNQKERKRFTKLLKKALITVTPNQSENNFNYDLLLALWNKSSENIPNNIANNKTSTINIWDEWQQLIKCENWLNSLDN